MDNKTIDLRSMTLFQSERVSACTNVRRVNGGHIYDTILEHSEGLAISSVFVELQRDELIRTPSFTPYTGEDQ
jgi:hypothetical protein